MKQKKKTITASLIPQETIENKILLIRGQKVMLDRDLAVLYGVSTKVLNQAVKRNSKRFPKDFMFRLTDAEKHEVVTICDHLQLLKFSPQLPYAFTEQGVAMLSSVLHSERAVQVNIIIMRAFVKLRQIPSLAHRLEQLEGKVEKHDDKIHTVFEAIRQLMAPPLKPKKQIGFHPGNS